MQTRNVNKFLESIILWDICKWQGTSLVSEWPPYPIGHNTDPSLMLVTTFMCPRLTVTEKFLDLHLDDLHWESPWYSSIYCWWPVWVHAYIHWLSNCLIIHRPGEWRPSHTISSTIWLLFQSNTEGEEIMNYSLHNKTDWIVCFYQISLIFRQYEFVCLPPFTSFE